MAGLCLQHFTINVPSPSDTVPVGQLSPTHAHAHTNALRLFVGVPTHPTQPHPHKVSRWRSCESKLSSIWVSFG